MTYTLYKNGVWVMTCGTLEKAINWQKATEGSEIKEITQEKADSIKETLGTFEGNTLPFWGFIR